MRTSNVRLVYLLATREAKAYLDAIDPVDAEDRHEEDAAVDRLDQEFLVQTSGTVMGGQQVCNQACRPCDGGGVTVTKIERFSLLCAKS